MALEMLCALQKPSIENARDSGFPLFISVLVWVVVDGYRMQSFLCHF